MRTIPTPQPTPNAVLLQQLEGMQRELIDSQATLCELQTRNTNFQQKVLRASSSQPHIDWA